MTERKPHMIGSKYTAEFLYETVKLYVERKTSNSKVLDPEREALIPRLNETELQLGKVLGRGGFCMVVEITKITLSNEFCVNDVSSSTEVSSFNTSCETTSSLNLIQNRSFMAKHYLRGENKECRYAVKKLQDSTLKNDEKLANGTADLALEVRFLSVLSHPNIIKLRAVAMCGPYDKDFFIVLDKLYDTLSKRIFQWRKERPNGFMRMLDRKMSKERELWNERLAFAYDIASALKYLHSSNIMYRDIKPDNIGFDIRGDIKIFDFGLAKEFDPEQRNAQGLFKLTTDTGSPRYMDPLVARGEQYNELSDVYSFCILLWQIIQLETPFQDFNVVMFNKLVVKGGTRPPVKKAWPLGIRSMMCKGWGDISVRPNMSEICDTLYEELSKQLDDIPETKSDQSLRSLRKSHASQGSK